MSIELFERRMIELDPDLAKHYLNYNDYETQRAIRPLHVLELSEKMKNGLFRYGEVCFASKNGDRDRMMNGQHVCSAVIESGVTVPAVLERYKAKTEKDMSTLFRQFEIMPRSLNDMVKVEANALGLTWPIDVSRMLVAVAAIEHTGFSKGSIYSVNAGKKTALSKEQKVEMLRNYLEEGAFLAKIITGKRDTYAHLAKVAVCCVLVKTSRKNEKKAFDFWKKVKTGEFLSKDMPEMKLREFLKASRQSSSKISNHEYSYRSILAWNAYIKKKATNLAYRADNPLPKIVWH